MKIQLLFRLAAAGLLVLLCALGLEAQSLDFQTIDLPLSKKGSKFGQHTGLFSTEDGAALHTFYVYREKQRSKPQFDFVSLDAANASITDHGTRPLTREAIEFFAARPAAALLELESSIPERFNGPVTWIRRDFNGYGLGAMKIYGRFVPVYADGFLLGYEFEKTNGKDPLLGRTSSKLWISFAEPKGAMVGKDSDNLLWDKLYSARQAGTLGFVPSGEQVLVGGVVSGRVKIGEKASEDFNNYRFMTATYDAASDELLEERYFEFDKTLAPLSSVTTAEGNTLVLLRANKFGTGVTAGKKAKPEGLLTLAIAPSGDTLWTAHLNKYPELAGGQIGAFDYNPLQVWDGETYLLDYEYGKKNRGLHLARLTRDGKIVYDELFTEDDLQGAARTAGKEKAGKLKKVTGIEFERVARLQDGNVMALGFLKGIKQHFILRFNYETGQLQDFNLIDQVAAERTKVSTGDRWISRVKTTDEEAYPIPTVVTPLPNGNILLLFRSQTGAISLGAKSFTTKSTATGPILTTTTTFTRTVDVDELFAFGKAMIFDPKSGKLDKPYSFGKTTVVGTEPVTLSANGQRIYVTCYNKRAPTLYTAKL